MMGKIEFSVVFFATAIGIFACSPHGDSVAPNNGNDPVALNSAMAQSAKTAEPIASAAPSAAAPADPPVVTEPYLVLMEEIGAIHTRNGRDCAKMGKELEDYLDAHNAEIRSPDKKVAVAIDADPAQKARMKAAMTAIMDGSAPCGSNAAFKKLMEKLRGDSPAPKP